MKVVYLLQHSYEVGEEEAFDEVKMLGIYSSKEKAEKMVEKYKNIPGFKNCLTSCFYIGKYEIDKDHWTEGFFKDK